jgi:hypothetical protein
MSESKGAAIADRAPLFELGGPSHLFTWLLSPFRQRGLVDTYKAQNPKAVDIGYGICVGLVAEWVRLHTTDKGKDAHYRMKVLSTGGRDIAVKAQVSFLKFKGEAREAGSKGAIGAALKQRKVSRTISATSPKWYWTVTDVKIGELRTFLTAQVSSQDNYYIFNLYFGVDGHAVAAYHEATAMGGALRIFEPNFGEFLVPYDEFGRFWTDLIAEYRRYRDRAGTLDPKVLNAIAVHTLTS